LRCAEDEEAERIARAVFKVVSKHITTGEIKDIKRDLPNELYDLWR